MSIQPRTRVWRYLTDDRTHYHLGYNLFVEGNSSEGKKQYTVAISEKQQVKMLFRIGDIIEGTAWTKQYEEREFADYYRAGSFKILNRSTDNLELPAPPWIALPPAMQTYEERGARLLSKSLWETKCFRCIWANMANVEIQWDFDKNLKNIALKPFVTDQNHASFIGWAVHVRFHIKTGIQLLMMDVWMNFVLVGEMKRNRIYCLNNGVDSLSFRRNL